MPHNFIRISAETPNPGLRNPDTVKRTCKDHDGVFECLLFDTDTQPQFAYVLVKDGKVDEMLAALGGTLVFRYFDRSEVK